jgi:lipopolysaccharide biosynthesis glycosyltransferase
MYGRLILPLYFKNRDKIVYSDADVIFLRDLSTLFEIDLRVFPVAGVTNIDKFALRKLLDTKTDKPYLDSGLLIFNTKIWNDRELTQSIFKILKEKLDLKLPDNDAINIAINGDYLEINPHFSYQSHYYNTYPETRVTGNQAVVLQFAGPIKPNSYASQDHFRFVYREFLSRTPYKATIDQDKSLKLILRRIWRKIDVKQ